MKIVNRESVKIPIPSENLDCIGKIFNNLRALEITLKWLFICFCGRMAVGRFLFTFCETFSSMRRKEEKF